MKYLSHNECFGMQGEGDLVLSDAMHKQWQLEEAFIASRANEDMRNKTHENTRNLVRLLQHNPLAIEALQSAAAGGSILSL
jgi:hypothetical protein